MKTTEEIIREHQDRMQRITEDGIAKASSLGEEMIRTIAQEAATQVAAKRAKLAGVADVMVIRR